MWASAFASCWAINSSAVAILRNSWCSPSPTSSYLRWKNSSRWCTVGMASKLCSLGGLAVIHSSERRLLALAGGDDHVDDEKQHADGEDQRSDRRDQVPEADVEEPLAGALG